MSHDAPTSPGPPAKLEQVIAVCLRAAELGIPVDQDELLARHPELADHLRAFFAAQSTQHVEADTAATDPDATRPLTASQAGEALHVDESLRDSSRLEEARLRFIDDRSPANKQAFESAIEWNHFCFMQKQQTRKVVWRLMFGCRSCGAPAGVPCSHDGGCIDSDRSG